MARGKGGIHHSFLKLLGPDSREETNSNSPGERSCLLERIYKKSNLFTGKLYCISLQPGLTLLLQRYTTSQNQIFHPAERFLKINIFIRRYPKFFRKSGTRLKSDEEMQWICLHNLAIHDEKRHLETFLLTASKHRLQQNNIQ